MQSEDKRKKIIVIAGPTACGKTAAAVKLARKIGGEVVSADSMQVYRGMDIGTAKPSFDERGGVPHHMIDIVDPDEPFSAALYGRMAAEVIGGIHARGKIPVLTGGTGFYVNAVLYGMTADEEDTRGSVATENESDARGSAVSENENDTRGSITTVNESDAEIRLRLESEAVSWGGGYLHELLREVDPDYAASVHPNNVRRVIRALAFYYSTGKKLSEHNLAEKQKPPLYDARFFVLNMERVALYKRIDERVLQMFKNGLADEVRGLLNAGYHTGLTSMQGIGYKETAAYLTGRISYDEAVSLIQANTRHYAKRQVTWFKHQAKGAEWVDAGTELSQFSIFA